MIYWQDRSYTGATSMRTSTTMILTESLPTYLHQMITTPLVYTVCRRDDGAGQPTRREHVEIKLDELRRAMEERGLKISRNNTEYLGTTSTKTQRSIYWERLKESEDIHDCGGYRPGAQDGYSC